MADPCRGPLLVFNDLHIALAVSRARGDGVERLKRSLDDYARHGAGDNREIPSCRRRLIDGVLAFAQGDYARSVEAILPCATKQSASAAAMPNATSSRNADLRRRALRANQSARALLANARRAADAAHEAGV